MVAMFDWQPPDAFVNTSKICPSGVRFMVMYILSTQEVWRTRVQPLTLAMSLRRTGSMVLYAMVGACEVTPKIFPRLHPSRNTVIPLHFAFQAAMYIDRIS